MIGLLCFVLTVLASPFKSKLRLQAENAVLRHQLNVVKRRLPGRVRLTNCVSAPNIDPSYCPICRYYPKLPLPMTIPCVDCWAEPSAFPGLLDERGCGRVGPYVAEPSTTPGRWGSGPGVAERLLSNRLWS
jgi:hypothetical protein